MLHGMYIANPPKGRRVSRKSRKAQAPAPQRRAKKRLRFSNPPASAPLMASRPAAISSAPSRKRRVAKRRASGMSGYARKGADFLGISDIFSADTLKMAGGVVVGSLGTNILYGSQALSFLPGRQNVFVSSLYKLLIAGAGAKLTSKVAPKAATGVMVGGLVVVANDLLTAFAPNLVMRPTTTTTTPATTSAYLGVNGYVPGVNPMLTGPASAYLAPASVGRTVESNFVSVAEAYGSNPFGA